VVDMYVRAMSRALGPAGPASRAEKAAVILPPLIRPEAARPLRPGEYLAFHPGSAWPGKRWPESHWAALASRCARSGLAMAFTGAPEERPEMDRILARLDPAARASVIDCVGATTLLGSAWIHGHARMTVTGDTVAMHLAAACGTPTLSLFGASNPVETGPYGKGHVIIQTDPDPLPDLAFERENAGLAHLGPDEVAEYLLEGIPPAGFPMWETAWDERGGMQILRDARRLPHPCLDRAAKLMDVLDRWADGPEAASADGKIAAEPLSSLKASPKPGGSREMLLRVLAAGGDHPGAESIAALERAEKDLAEDTQGSLIWEAYRIAINGLPLKDLGQHLAARKARLEQALREEALASAR
jgi:hypothetical protein